MKQVLFFDIKKVEVEFLKKNPSDYEMVLYSQSLTFQFAKTLSKDEKKCEIISVFLTSKLDEKVLVNFPYLKTIITRSTGTNHIDLEYCKKRGINVENVCCYGSITVAEFTIGLILNLMRKINEASKWSANKDVDFEKYLGHDLYGKTVGIIGAGEIGANVIRMLAPFNCKVLVYDIKKNESLLRQKIKYVNLETLLKNSDIISLHCPYIEDVNHHMISKKQISMMKDGAYIINTARGALINIIDLYEALKKGKLRGVALDVLEYEILNKNTIQNPKDKVGKKIMKINQEIRKFDNVIITPHIAFDTNEALIRILTTVLKKLN